ncbi:MAG TPA: DNA gyrase/topoisomerase IV subunit A, partial [Bacteroidia bacterium]
ILAANDKGKIKVKKVEDNTAENVEILIHLQPGISPDKTIDALYAFTNCEMSISPNSCVIENDKPRFLGASEMLKLSTHQTLEQLRLELELDKKELEEKWHFASLEKIFIKEEMYIDFKKYSDKETLFKYLYTAFAPHKKKLIREINDDDLHRLTQIPMIRITRFDSIKAEDHLKELEGKIAVVKNHLANLVEYAVDYFKTLKKKYGEGRERKTEIKQLDTIVATQVVMANEKLYVNKAEGFVGTSLKKDEFVCDCSDIDDIIAFTKEGKMKIFKVQDKVFVGKDIIYVAVFKKNDERTTYNLIYTDGPKGITFIKRFNVSGVTRDKEYNLTKGTPNSNVHWFTINPNGEAEKVTVHLKATTGVRKLEIDVDFAEIQVKGRTSLGNIVSKYAVRKVTFKSKGASTLGAEDYWFDDTTHRLNKEERGTYLGKFAGEDKILTITSKGQYKLYTYDLLNHFEEDIVLIEKYFPKQVVTLIYFNGESKTYLTKRFVPENISVKTPIITEHENSLVELVTSSPLPIIDVVFGKEKDKQPAPETINLTEFAPLVNMKAKGKRLTHLKVKEINLREAEEVELDEPPEETTGDNGLSPMELHRRAMEKISRKAAQDFMKGDDGQGKLPFD